MYTLCIEDLFSEIFYSMDYHSTLQNDTNISIMAQNKTLLKYMKYLAYSIHLFRNMLYPMPGTL